MSHVGTQQFSGAETDGRQPSASQENLSQCRASSTSSLVGQNTSTSAHDIHLKLLNPANKQDYKMFVLRNVSMDETDNPDTLKKVVIDQCGDAIMKHNLEIGYFRRSKKYWLNNIDWT